MGPLDKIRGFLANNGITSPSKNGKVKPQEGSTNSSVVAQRALALTLVDEARVLIGNIKEFRATRLTAANDPAIIDLNLAYKEDQLLKISEKINTMDLSALPKSEKKAVEATKKQMTKLLTEPLRQLEKELDKLSGKKKFSMDDQRVLKGLLQKFEALEKSPNNVKSDPELQKALLKTRDALGKAVITVGGFKDPDTYLKDVRFHHSDPHFDTQKASYALDFLIRNPPTREIAGEASDLWYKMGL